MVKKLFSEKNILTLIAVMILVLGVFLRVWQLGSVPGGMNQDEAFAGYEAYSILNYGMDSSGNRYPVYLNTWGSGMNALETYLMIPFIALFGVSAVTVRLPQCIVGCLTLLVFYLFLKKVSGERLALVGLFYLSICPWHIMLSRWGLESNLAPGFVLFGLYFFVLGLEKRGFMILSALFYGLSLYTYATIWPVLPVIIFLQLLYALYQRKLKFSPSLVISFLVLVFLATPLVLFLLVNKGYLEPINLPFMSIPRLTVMRGSEISFDNIPSNFKTMMDVLINQRDGLSSNTAEGFGLYYKGGLWLALAGLLIMIFRLFKSLKDLSFDGTILMLPTLIGGIIIGCLIEVNINRMNIIHLPIIMLASVTIYSVFELLLRWKAIGIGAYALGAFAGIFLLISFERYYYTDYKDMIGETFQEGLEQAVDRAVEIAGDQTTDSSKDSSGDQSVNSSPVQSMDQTGGGIIHVDGFNYSKVLLFSKEPVTEYISTVEYTNYPSEYLGVSRFGRFEFGEVDTYSDSIVYIIKPDKGEELESLGFKVEYFGNAAVAYF